ncbi:MAG: hypothetical protein ABEJ40_04930 [Haloarculaceae archaeon]
MTEELTDVERDLLSELTTQEGRSPSELALAIDADYGAVLGAVGDLRDRGLVDRRGFDTCRLTERGREVAAEASDRN